MMYSKWRGLCGILSLAGSLTLLGCGVKGNSYVRVVNASQGLSGFTVVAGQTQLVAGLPFGSEGIQQQGQYSAIDSSGNYRPLGAGTGQALYIYSTPGTNLVSTTQTFISKTPYTIVVEGTSPEFQVLTDGTGPSGGGLRVVDTSTMAGAVDVYITAVGASPGGTPAVGNMTYQQVTNPYLPSASGSLEVQVTPAGNPNKVLAKVLFNPASGKTYSIFVLDPPNGSAPVVPPQIPAVPGANTYGVLVTNDPLM
ncbi:MAG: DUF4397 domain-containing protein [Acidobacteriaceae bacterium]